MSTGITDETICSLLRGKNTMQHLEIFLIQATDKVTMAAVKASFVSLKIILQERSILTVVQYTYSDRICVSYPKHFQMLLLHCDKLSSIKHLTAFKMIHPMELAMLRAEMKSGNFEVDTGEEDEARVERVREEK